MSWPPQLAPSQGSIPKQSAEALEGSHESHVAAARLSERPLAKRTLPQRCAEAWKRPLLPGQAGVLYTRPPGLASPLPHTGDHKPDHPAE